MGRDDEQIKKVIAHEEFMVEMLRSDLGRQLVAFALRRAGVHDEAPLVANARFRPDYQLPLPKIVADGVIAHITNTLEQGIAVRRAALGKADR